MGERVFYTAIFGRISDELRVPLVADSATTGIRFVCFTDRGRYGSRYGPWEVRPAVWTHPSVPRRTARWHKANAHLLFPDAAVSLWCDGCLQLLVPPEVLFAEGAGGPDLMTFRHPQRTCVYLEAKACERFRKDHPQTMQAQVARYHAEGYPANNGLAETTCVLRRHGDRVEDFNRMWWAEMATGSLRDQLSFDYCCWRLKLPYGRLGGCRNFNDHFKFFPHRELSR